MNVQEALARIVDGGNLTAEEAEQVMAFLMLGEVHHGLIGGFLAAMQVKGVTGSELAGFAREMRKHAVQFKFDSQNLVDTCGTGGGRPTFNLSTGAAILAAACGAKVAKHGNRAVTSKCGSADVLEALGVPIEGNEADQTARFAKSGLVFLYAPSHHPAVRHVAPVRKAMGIRTLFNLLGPLANPAGASRQMVGVFNPNSMVPVAEALVELGTEHAFVVHGEDGMDEVTPCAATQYVEVKAGKISKGKWEPSDFGISTLDESALAHGDGVEGNAKILREALSDAESPKSMALIPNTAVTLVLAGIASDVASGAKIAQDAVRSGKAIALLNQLAGA
ncbi:MAG: anthranilate phosphoribosyltransferase [Fimbriimonadaceae bacterium]|nr:anthranilate phosphoribosyltransferase [Fimbriimonadaceae bacterium]